MINFKFGEHGPDHCGKKTRKYLFVIGGAAVLVLLGTYLYEFQYLPKHQQQMLDQSASAVNQPQAAGMTNVASQFAAPSWMGMTVAANQGPPIGANAATPGNHRRDGRDKAPCESCHQIVGAPQGNAVNFIMPVNEDPRVRAGLSPGLLQGPSLLPGQLMETERQAFASVVQQIRPSVVNINSVRSVNTGQASPAAQKGGGPRFATPMTGNSIESIGSGVIISNTGYIVTNYHVISGATGIFATVFTEMGPKRYLADIIKVDETKDLALIKVEPDELLTRAHLGDSDKVHIADSVLAIGSPFGLDQTVSRGIVSGVRKAIVIDNTTHDQLIQTDAAINQGNSGGPLVMRNGDVIGINTAIYTPSGAFAGIGFAIPINKVKNFVRDHVPSIATGMPVKFQAQPGWNMNNIAAPPAAPPIRAGSTPPGSHTDGRNQMPCETCHQIAGGGANPVNFTNQAPSAMGNVPPAGVPFAMPVAQAERAPRILAVRPAPHRDGREKMDCRICHQIIEPNNANQNQMPQAQGGAVTGQAVAGVNQFAMAPQSVTVAATAAATSQIYFEGAVLEPISSIVLQRVNVQVSDGAFVSTVYPNTGADRAGLNAGDIIFKINGRWVMSPEDLIARINDYQVGDNLRLGVYTGGQRRNLYIVLSGLSETPALNKVGAAPAGAAPQTVLPNEMTWLGMELKPISPNLAAKKPELQGLKGTLISDVDRNSTAEWAGMQKGDIVKQINGLPVNSMDELDRVVKMSNAGQGVLFLLNRNGRDIYLTVQG